VKSAGDRLFAAVALLALLPILLVTALCVRILLGAPVLFRQVRPGRHGRLFTVVKFRTMLDTRDADGELLPDHERVTPFGSFLRSSSLDELPQLWNVLRGDLSFVGPRPLLVEYLERYSPEQARRHDVAPGITGWSQVNGRNDMPWDEKLAHDVWYVDNWSLALDARIVFLTVLAVLGRRGISREGHATAPAFTGSAGSPAGAGAPPREGTPELARSGESSDLETATGDEPVHDAGAAQHREEA